jgi:hypothetical protein
MMNRFLLLLVSAVLSCPTAALERFHKIDESRSPMAFLDEVCSLRAGVYVVEDSVRGWVQPSDVSELMELIDSDRPCSSVALVVSSRLRWEGSTMGDEAAFLIEGFRQGTYPPGLTSEPLSDADRAALKDWWNAAKPK